MRYFTGGTLRSQGDCLCVSTYTSNEGRRNRRCPQKRTDGQADGRTGGAAGQRGGGPMRPYAWSRDAIAWSAGAIARSQDSIASISGSSAASRGPERRPARGARAPVVRADSPAEVFAHRASNRSATRQDRGLRRRFRNGVGLNRDIRGAGSRRVKSAMMLPPDRTNRPRECAAGHEGEQRRHRCVRDGSGPERNNIWRVRDDPDVKRNNLELNRNGFSARAMSGTSDASSPHATGTRRVRVGSLVLSSSSRVPRCPAILRPMQKEEV
jgi:hypothetical protein